MTVHRYTSLCDLKWLYTGTRHCADLKWLFQSWGKRTLNLRNDHAYHVINDAVIMIMIIIIIINIINIIIIIIIIIITQRHSRNIHINILLYTRDKMVDSKYINYNTNTYTLIRIYYVIIQIYNTDIWVSKYL